MYKEANRTSQTEKRVPMKRKHLVPYVLIFVLVPIFTFFVGKYLDQIWALGAFPQFPFNLITGSTVFSLGLYIGIKSTRVVSKIGRGLPWGDFNGEAQSTRLVTQGPYAYTRNPMTIGYAALPCGMGLMFQSLSMAIIVPVLALVATVLWIKIKEEPALVKRFGDEYQEYKRKTPFLIPKPKQILFRLKTNAKKA